MVYVKRMKTYPPTIQFYLKKGKGLQQWCGEMSYGLWYQISGIALDPGQIKKAEIREVD